MNAGIQIKIGSLTSLIFNSLVAISRPEKKAKRTQFPAGILCKSLSCKELAGN
jgi:hypothetical protein